MRSKALKFFLVCILCIAIITGIVLLVQSLSGG